MTEATTNTAMPLATGAASGGGNLPFRLLLLMRTFELSIGDVARASGGTISKTQIHRIINGKPPSPSEKAAVAGGVLVCLCERCRDSAFLFEDDA